MGGIRVEVSVGSPTGCALPSLSRDATIHSVNRSTHHRGEGEMVIEFTVEGGLDEDSAPVGVESVFSAGDDRVYRLERDCDDTCVCETVEGRGCPTRSLRFVDGRADVVFIAPCVTDLRDVVSDLRDRFGSVALRRLSRVTPEEGCSDLVPVDRSQLTERQRETLETAHEMGYFRRPREANGTAVAEELGITVATFSGHLAAAQSKLLDAVLDDAHRAEQ